MSKTKIKQHDALVKLFLSDLTVAREFLKHYLPHELQSKCDFNSISIEPESYIENDLKRYCSDLVYKVNIDSGKEIESAYIYLLIEHQSTAELLMPLRMLRYQLAIIQKHVDKQAQNVLKLPVVVPIVLYNGLKSPYPHTPDIADLFEDQALYQQMPVGRFRLIDLTTMSDEELLKHNTLSVLEVMIKHIHRRDLMLVAKSMVKALQIGYQNGMSESLLNGVFSYLSNAREGKELKPLFNKFIDELTYYEDNIMTYAEELKQEGIKIGMTYAEELKQLGKQEGIQIGEQRVQDAHREIAQQLLKSGVDSTIIANATHLTPDQIEELKNL